MATEANPYFDPRGARARQRAQARVREARWRLANPEAHARRTLKQRVGYKEGLGRALTAAESTARARAASAAAFAARKSSYWPAVEQLARVGPFSYRSLASEVYGHPPTGAQCDACREAVYNLVRRGHLVRVGHGRFALAGPDAPPPYTTAREAVLRVLRSYRKPRSADRIAQLTGVAPMTVARCCQELRQLGHAIEVTRVATDSAARYAGCRYRLLGPS